MKSRTILLSLLALVALWLLFGTRKSFASAMSPGPSSIVRRAPTGNPDFYFLKADASPPEACDSGYTKDPQRPLACIKSK